MKTKAQAAAQARYEKKRLHKDRYKTYLLKCHIKHDADVIDALSRAESKNGYIKALIRADLE